MFRLLKDGKEIIGNQIRISISCKLSSTSLLLDSFLARDKFYAKSRRTLGGENMKKRKDKDAEKGREITLLT